MVLCATECCVLALPAPAVDRRKTLLGEVALMTAPTSTLHQKEMRLLSGAIVLGPKRDALITRFKPLTSDRRKHPELATASCQHGEAFVQAITCNTS